jgi:hypothetical protein
MPEGGAIQVTSGAFTEKVRGLTQRKITNAKMTIFLILGPPFIANMNMKSI